MSENNIGLAGRNIIKVFMSEARHKPHIQELLYKLPDLTQDDISALSYPILPWHKNALLELKKREGDDEAEKRAEVIADLMGPIIDSEKSSTDSGA
jgi:hypothetical protein